jgi:hypothetical protein
MVGQGVAHTVDRVRIRPGAGPRSASTGRRLVRIAHEHLGPALDRALSDVDDELDIERIVVTFPADPDELDDEAVAMLWASLVRDSLERLRGARGPSTTSVTTALVADQGQADGAVPASPAADLVALVGALQRWTRDGTAPTKSELELGLDRPDMAEQALAQLPEPWPALARELLGRAAVPTSGDALSPPPSLVAARPGTPAPSPPTAPPGAGREAAESAAPVPPPPGPQGSTAEEARDPEVPSAATEPWSAQVPVSGWGGLVLLHYRLRPYLEQAAGAEPGRDPVTVRTAALALLAEDPSAAGDPLVGLLSGHLAWSTAEEHGRFAWRDPGAAAARAHRLLQDFAGDLPGFGASSPGFVREQWLRRRALLLEDPPAVLLTLERRPLDLVLERLPYPIGALRLPWTPPLFVGWERP